MTQNNVKILLALLAVLMVGGSYMYIYKPNKESKESIEAENEVLQARLDDLREKEKNRDKYIAETTQYYEDFEKVVADFPATLDQEVSVMFIKGAEDARDGEFTVNSVGLGRPAEFYTLGGGEDSYVCKTAAFPIAYEGSYEGLKAFIDYIMEYKYRMNITAFNIAYSQDQDLYTGSISLNAYCVTGGDREADTINVDVPTGVDNIFIGGEDAISGGTYSYDADNGDSIKTNNDVMINLVNANNNTSDGIIISSGDDKTYVTSSENSVETVTLKVYEDAGKNYATYSMAGNEYTTELTGKDVKVYVKSSERVDADDKNGVKLNIDNSTSLNVFIKVEGDDTTGARFSVGSKSGVVKVY